MSEENLKLKERCSRLEMAEQSLSEAYEKSKNELFAARLEAMKATAEAKFHADRVKDLDESRKLLQSEVETTTLRCRELDGFVIAQQKEAAARENALFAAEERTRAALERVRQLEVEVEVLNAAEKRAIGQLAETREEVKRQASLAESVSRIEASLFARAEEERAAAARDRDVLSRSLEAAKKEASDQALVADEKIRSLEEQCAAARRRAEEAIADAASLREELVRVTGLAAASQDRAALLEKQLSFAQEQIGSIHGAQTMASVRAEDAALKDMQLEKAEKDVESLRAQLAAAEQHVEQFRKIGASTEAMLKELRERSSATKSALEAKIATLQAEAEAGRIERAERLAAALKSEEEVSELRGQLREQEKKHAEETASLLEQLTMAKAMADQAVAQSEVYKSDAEACQQAARSAQGNYDRELQLHAAAASRARESEVALESLRVQMAVANQKLSEVSADAIRREKQSEEVVRAAKEEASRLTEEISSLRRANDLLHSQVQSLGVQVDRLQYSRATSAAEGHTDSSRPAADSAVTQGTDQELAELRSSLSEMREVIRYMKREKDILDARHAVLETENARHMGNVSALQRALDEARVELRKELEAKSKGLGTRTEDEFHRLMAEVTQLNIVRESNAHLRGENEELARKMAKLTDELRVARESVTPLTDKIRHHESTIASLTTERNALSSDATYWKDRLHQLLSRYNDVDPEAHRMLSVRLAETETRVASLSGELESAKSKQKVDGEQIAKLTADLEAVTKELESSKSAVDAADKSAELLRSRLRDFNKQRNDMKAEIQKLTQDLETARSAPPLPVAAPVVATPVSAVSSAAVATLVAPSSSTAALPHAAASVVTLSVPVAAAVPASAAAIPATRKRPFPEAASEAPAAGDVTPAAAAAPEVPATAPAASAAEEAAPKNSEQLLREQLLKRKKAGWVAGQKAAAAAKATEAGEGAAAPPLSVAAGKEAVDEDGAAAKKVKTEDQTAAEASADAAPAASAPSGSVAMEVSAPEHPDVGGSTSEVTTRDICGLVFYAYLFLSL